MTDTTYSFPEINRRLIRIEDTAATLSNTVAAQQVAQKNDHDDIVGLRNDFKWVVRALVGLAFSIALSSAGIIITILEATKN